MKNYETEACERWGNTDAYREYEQKTKNYSKEKWTEANDGLMAIFAKFAALKNSGVSADSAEAQALADKLQAHIAENYIHFYNTHRYQKRLNCMTPCEYYLSTAA